MYKKIYFAMLKKTQKVLPCSECTMPRYNEHIGVWADNSKWPPCLQVRSCKVGGMGWDGVDGFVSCSSVAVNILTGI